MIAAGVRIVTQNGLYDWGWLRADARRRDAAVRAARRDRRAGDPDRREPVLATASTRSAPGAACPARMRRLLEEAVKAAGFKISKKNPLQSYIWQLPAHFVGPYAEADPIDHAARYLRTSNPILDQEGTRAAYRLDVDLLPMVHEMRRRGIRIDQSAAEQARDYCLQKRDAALAELSEQLGTPVSMDEIASPKWKARTFDAHGINYPRTEKGNPSFKAGKTGWMATHPHWLPQLIATANKYDHAGSTFLEGHILEHLIGGRIYAEINPHSARTTAAHARSGSRIPIRRCSRCRRATRSWGR